MTDNDWWIWNYIGDRDSLNKLGLHLTNEQIEHFLSSFMEIFNNNWYYGFLEYKRERILNRYFKFNCGPYSIPMIIRLGECIFNLREINSFNDEIVTRLRDKKQFESVSIELDYSSCFAQAGMQLELQPLINDRKGDGKLIINGKHIFYEVINQDSEIYKKRQMSRNSEIFDFLKEKFGSRRIFIRFKRRDSDAEIKLKKLFNILRSVELPFDYDNDDLEVHIADKNGGSIILGDILNREKKLERWIEKVHQKYKQLPPNVGGVVIANSSRLWDPRDIELASKTSWRVTKESHKSRISGIVFCARQMIGTPSISGERLSLAFPLLLINKFTKFDYSNELKKMASAINSFPDWI